MSTAVVIDENLLAEARRITGLKETNDVMREALRTLIERESARRLARLGTASRRCERFDINRQWAPG